MRLQPQYRVISLIGYALSLAVIQYYLVETSFTPNENAIWLFNGVASLLFGSRVLNPHFTPPADAATNSFVALASLIAGSLAVPQGSADSILIWVVAAICALISLLSIVVLLVRTPTGIETRNWVRAVDHAVRGIGSPNVIFTFVILTAVWLFHRERPIEIFAIVAVWTAIVALRPIEAVLSYGRWLKDQPRPILTEQIIGEVAAYQSPGIVLIRQLGEGNIKRGTPLIVADNNGPWMLGVALNYVGRDEGNLLRVLTTSLPEKLKTQVLKLEPPKGAGVAMKIDIPADELADNKTIQWINRLCGVVDNDTSLDYLQFEVIEDEGLSEGRLVEARIGDHWVMFQIIEGLTREEIVQQKNKYGYARAKARKIGRWDEGANKFQPVKWIPRINAPVFLKTTDEFKPTSASIGHFPGTDYGVGVNISEAVTHNTAILGILGIGKTYLAIELVERMIANGIKVICLDLTNQYSDLLHDFLDQDYEEAQIAELEEAARGGEPRRNKELGGSRQAFRERITGQLREFVSADNRRLLRIYNPAQFQVTRQASGMYEGQADMATLTPSEITAIVSDAALTVCQELGMTDEGRVCLVYEEAHSLVPEWNSVAAEGDKTATAQSARAILQGRKYGLGCLLITQRTANVTKTILNQCNTIFAMRTFDDTGKVFLSNYIGGDYAGILPSLETRQAVLFGKASTCENPVLIRLNDRDRFLEAFRQENAPPPIPQAPPDIVVQEVAAAPPVPEDDPEDEVPF